jgi:cyclopropane fatty-acyl-phospholipid synthase-like methyltransferase
MDESFDKAVAADLIEHIPDEVFSGMLDEVRRVLRSKGTLSIYTPCPTHIIERLKKRNFLIPHNPTHTNLRKMKDIQSLMEKGGFEVNLAYYTAGFIPVINWIEYLMKPLPVIGDFFRYRICIRGLKNS